MSQYHFKTPWYRFYAPKLFKLYRMFALRLAKSEALNEPQTSLLIDYVWDRFLSQKIAQEALYFGGKTFSLKQHSRSSDTLFILGCGASINEINDAQWQTISQHDSIGINYFYIHGFQPSFHMIELGQSALSLKCLNDYLLNDAKRKKESVFLHIRHLLKHNAESIDMQRENLSFYSPSVLKGRDDKLIKSVVSQYYQNSSNLIHHASNLDVAIHFGFLMGYRKIKLLGVDLNNSEYFWESMRDSASRMKDIIEAVDDDYRIASFDTNKSSVHATASEKATLRSNSMPITEYLKILHLHQMQPNGVRLVNASEHSLLRQFIPFEAI